MSDQTAGRPAWLQLAQASHSHDKGLASVGWQDSRPVRQHGDNSRKGMRGRQTVGLRGRGERQGLWIQAEAPGALLPVSSTKASHAPRCRTTSRQLGHSSGQRQPAGSSGAGEWVTRCDND